MSSSGNSSVTVPASPSTRLTCYVQQFSAIVRCIRHGDDLEYSMSVDSFVEWCELNQLLVVDLRSSRPQRHSSINGGRDYSELQISSRAHRKQAGLVKQPCPPTRKVKLGYVDLNLLESATPCCKCTTSLWCPAPFSVLLWERERTRHQET